jgi:hypothetical protein
MVNKLAYKHLPSANHPDPGESITAHLLVVKDRIYAHAAVVCISSFLYWNERASVIIHTDDITHDEVTREVEKLTNRNRVIVSCDYSLRQSSWQDLKLELVLSLSGTKDVYMDADLRWNARLPSLSRIKGIIFFVEEFTFETVSDYAQIFHSLKRVEHLSKSMKNTSFLCLNGHLLAEKDIVEVKIFIERFRNKVNEMASELNDSEQLLRLSEQVTLSTIFGDTEIGYLKLEDRRFDGSFVESSYLGSTGAQFLSFGFLRKPKD